VVPLAARVAPGSEIRIGHHVLQAKYYTQIAKHSPFLAGIRTKPPCFLGALIHPSRRVTAQGVCHVTVPLVVPALRVYGVVWCGAPFQVHLVRPLLPADKAKQRPWTIVLRHPFDPKAHAFARPSSSSPDRTAAAVEPQGLTVRAMAFGRRGVAEKWAPHVATRFDGVGYICLGVLMTFTFILEKCCIRLLYYACLCRVNLVVSSNQWAKYHNIGAKESKGQARACGSSELSNICYLSLFCGACTRRRALVLSGDVATWPLPVLLWALLDSSHGLLPPDLPCESHTQSAHTSYCIYMRTNAGLYRHDAAHYF
jgi:hypothetical protein